MPITNLFAAEPLIIARIKAMVPGLKTVASASILAGAQDIAPYCPAAFVLPMGGDVDSNAGRGIVQVERQRWQIVVVVSNIRDPLDVDTTAQQAGGYLLQVYQALCGWPPAADLDPMRYAGRPDPYYEVGYGEFPVLFETKAVLQGTP
jgi:hypothetical protein